MVVLEEKGESKFVPDLMKKLCTQQTHQRICSSAYIERCGEGVYLHHVFLLVLDDVVHAHLRSLVRISKLLLGVHHANALLSGNKLKKNLGVRVSHTCSP